jgi:hypothetical protein
VDAREVEGVGAGDDEGCVVVGAPFETDGTQR